MIENSTTKLTPKAQQTRQRIFDTAIALFVEKGYEATTMIDIANGAGCSPGLAYRYFSGKDALVLELWQHLADQFTSEIGTINDENWVDRYYHAMQMKIEQLLPYRDVIKQTVGAAMSPSSGVAIISEETAPYRDVMLASFERLGEGANNAPQGIEPQQQSIIMYGIHLVMILVWIYDRTPNQRLTQRALSFMYDTMKLMRPLLMLPPVSGSFKRLAAIMEGIFMFQEEDNN